MCQKTDRRHRNEEMAKMKMGRRRNYNRWNSGLVVVSLKIRTTTGQISRGISNKKSWPAEKYLGKVFVS